MDFLKSFGLFYLLFGVISQLGFISSILLHGGLTMWTGFLIVLRIAVWPFVVWFSGDCNFMTAGLTNVTNITK